MVTDSYEIYRLIQTIFNEDEDRFRIVFGVKKAALLEDKTKDQRAKKSPVGSQATGVSGGVDDRSSSTRLVCVSQAELLFCSMLKKTRSSTGVLES
jgi:hypothetical protein